MAVFQVVGKCPVEIDALMLLVINGDIKKSRYISLSTKLVLDLVHIVY